MGFHDNTPGPSSILVNSSEISCYPTSPEEADEWASRHRAHSAGSVNELEVDAGPIWDEILESHSQ